MVQVGHTDEETKAALEKTVATKQLRFAVETKEERLERLEKMVVTTRLRLSLESEVERRAKKYLDLIWIDIGF